MKIKIVCISGKAQHGKDTVANYINGGEGNGRQNL